MSRSAGQAGEVLDGIVRSESAKDRAERALAAAERVDRAAKAGRGRSRKLVRFLLFATVLGAVAVVARKLMGDKSSSPASPRPSPATVPPTEAAAPSPAGGQGAATSATAAAADTVGRNGDHPVDAVGAEPVRDDPTT